MESRMNPMESKTQQRDYEEEFQERKNWLASLGDDDLKPGDVVRLKSGGCRMVIKDVWPSYVCCQWSNDEHEVKEALFQNVVLKRGKQ